MLRWTALLAVSVAAGGCSLRLAEDSGGGRCGTAAVLRDDFEGSALSPRWDTVYPDLEYDEPTVEGGAAVIRWNDTATRTLEGYIVSSFGYDVRDQSVSIRIASVAEASETWFGVSHEQGDLDNALTIGQEGGELTARIGNDTVGTTPYDASASVWTLTFEGDLVSFAAGEDAGAEPFAEMVLPPGIDPRSAVIMFGTSTDAGIPGEARFEAINLERPPQSECPVADFADSFDDAASLERLWPRSSTDRTECSFVYGGGGVLEMTTTGPDCGLETRSAFSLANSSIELDLAGLPDLPDDGDDAYLSLFTPSGAEVFIEYSDVFGAGTCDADDNCFTVDAEPMGDERLWRIHSDGERVFFEVSSGGDFREIYKAVPGFDITALGVRVGIRSGLRAGTVVLDDLNVE